MVPHIQVEEAIMQIVGDNDGVLNIGVTSVPDEKKGERLIVLHTEISKTPSEITKELSKMGLPNLFIPSDDSFISCRRNPNPRNRQNGSSRFAATSKRQSWKLRRESC